MWRFKGGRLNIRKLLNTLFITSEEAYIHKEGDSVAIKLNGELIGRVPIHNIESIVCFNYVGISPRVMELCVKNNVLVSFISNSGRFLAKVDGSVSGNVLLRKKQYKLYDEKKETSGLVRDIILGKLINYKKILMRFTRDHPQNIDDDFLKNINELDKTIKKLYTSEIEEIDILRGYEGLGSKIYFKNFDKMILRDKENFYFKDRNKRPPMDFVNCMLSFIYTLIVQECTSALEMVGLDPQVGFLHRIRPGRSSLSLDLMEEFRGYLGDRLILKLINNRVITDKEFCEKENNAVLLTDLGRKKILEAYQERKKDIIEHPFLKEKIDIGLLPYSQAMILARVIRGDLEKYPVFLIK